MFSVLVFFSFVAAAGACAGVGVGAPAAAAAVCDVHTEVTREQSR